MKDKIMLLRTHPYSIFPMLKEFIPLLLIPLARGMYNAVALKGVKQWLRGARYDIFVLIIAVLLAVLYWSSEKFGYNENGLLIKRGVFSKETVFIPNDKITVINSKMPFLLRPIFCVKVSGDTNAGTKRRYEFKVYLLKKDAEKFLKDRYPAKEEIGNYFVQPKYTLLQALLSSNSLVGAVLLVSFFTGVRRYVTKEIEDTILQAFVKSSQLIEKILSSTFITILAFISAAWFIGFIRHLVYYAKLKIKRNNELLTISHGFLTRRYYQISPSKINFLNIQETVFTRLFSLSKISLHSSGFGKGKNNRPILIPIITNPDKNTLLAETLPDFTPSEIKLKTGGKDRLMSFLGPPLFNIIPTYLIGILLLILSKNSWVDGILSIFLIVVTFPLLWMLIIKMLEMKHSGIGETSQNYTLYYSTNFHLHTVIIPKNKISKINIRQSLGSKLAKSGKCIIKIYPYGEKKSPIFIRGMMLETSMDFFDKRAI